MDNVTHTLFALTLANAGVGRSATGATATLLVASNAPDIDIVTAFTGGAVEYLAAHRGPTHGPIGVVALSALTAAVVSLFIDEENRSAAVFRRHWAIAAVGVVGHVLMDYPTSYFTRIWSPFSQAWYGVDWLPIIDVYLLALLAGGLFAAQWRPGRRSQIAMIVLLLMMANYGARGTLHRAALREARSLAAADAAAIPTFSSPFRWRVIRVQDDRYDLADIDLLNRKAHGPAAVFPNDRNEWTTHAASSPVARVFLAFSRYPAAQTTEEPDGTIVVRWQDLRFLGPGFEANRYFVATVRVARDGTVRGRGAGVRGR